MFGQVNETEFDLRFTLFGVPVRVHPIFWLSSLFLAWVPNRPVVTFVQVLCLFVAVLVHEMGHALMNARFGFRSEIVLYILGGYATSMRHSTWRDIAVSAAGPGAGFLLLIVIYVPLKLTGLVVNWSVDPVFSQEVALQLPEAIRLGSPGFEILARAISFSIFINLIVNVMNLAPVLPLDGGQISRELFLRYRRRDGMKLCLQTSLVTAIVVAVYALHQRSVGGSVLGLDPLFLAVMFGLLAYQNFQSLQANRNGYW